MLDLSDEIIAFSELGDAIVRPVKTYSSGMVVRLAFALVTAVQPDLLIVDEALAVGDQHFQKKCVQRIEAFRSNGCTILFCSHSLYHVRQLCDQILWLDRGRVRGFGGAESVLAAYETHVRLQDPTAAQDANQICLALPREPVVAVDSVRLTLSGKRAGLVNASVLGLGHNSGVSLDSSSVPILTGEDLVVVVTAISQNDEVPSVGVMLEQFQGVGITSVATHADGAKLTTLAIKDGWTTWQVTLTFPSLPLHSGHYCLSFYLFDGKGLVVYDEWKDFVHFHWISPSLTPGLVRLPHRWT